MTSHYKVIPAKKQKAGALLGGFWVVMQAWPIANLYTVALLGPEGAKITGGYGNWEVSEVPRDVGITEWKGRTNYAMDIDLLYDGWITHPIRPDLPASFIGHPKLPQGVRMSRSDRHARATHHPAVGGGVWIEDWLKRLEDLAICLPHEDAPHSVRVFGAVPHPEVRWVIQSIDWGDSIRDKRTGRRMRQQATVHLLEYNQPTDLKKLPRSKKKTDTKKKGHKHKGEDKNHKSHKPTAKKK